MEYQIKTKKVDAKVYKFISAFDSTISKLITYSEAWDKIIKKNNITYTIYSHDTPGEQFTEFKLIYIDTKDIINEWQWPNKDVWYGGQKGYDWDDWNWNFLYKTAFEFIIKNKLIKKPRKKIGNKEIKSNKVDKCKGTTKKPVKSNKKQVKSKIN